MIISQRWQSAYEIIELVLFDGKLNTNMLFVLPILSCVGGIFLDETKAQQYANNSTSISQQLCLFSDNYKFNHAMNSFELRSGEEYL